MLITWVLNVPDVDLLPIQSPLAVHAVAFSELQESLMADDWPGFKYGGFAKSY